jgi:hypothetical protein
VPLPGRCVPAGGCSGCGAKPWGKTMPGEVGSGVNRNGPVTAEEAIRIAVVFEAERVSKYAFVTDQPRDVIYGVRPGE